MPIPSSINDLSTTAGSNSPAGSESPSLIDDYLRAYASYIAILRDQNSTTPQTIASAATTDIGLATTTVINVTGTTTITALGTVAAGTIRYVNFSGILILTHNATSLILPGGFNITTAANDSAEFHSLGSGNWICRRYTLANTKPAPTVGTVSQSGGSPTGALIETGTNANGSYTKWADGTMVAWGRYPGNALSWTAGTGVRYAQFTGFSLPVTFVGAVRSATTAVNTDISTLSSYIANFDASGNTYSGYLAAPSGTTGTGSHNFQWICFGRWY